MTSPVFQALVNARQHQLNRDEAIIAEEVNATLGPTPPDTHRPVRFIKYCDERGFPWRPATPSVIASFVLGHTKLGTLIEELRTLSLAHTGQNLPDPCAAYQVTVAISRVVKSEPPRSWLREHQLLWHALPGDLQQYLFLREKQRDTEVRRAQNEAAEARKAIQKGTDNGTTENAAANPD